MDVNGQEHEGTPFAEKGRLRRLGPSPLALCLRALCLLDAHHASGCTVQAALQTVFGPSRQGHDAAPDGVMDSGKLRAACHVAPAGPNARDRALAAELTYGALRHERRLGFVLGKCVSKPQGLPLPLRRLLQAGTYALVFLERVPPHAVVHTAVNLASSLYGSRLGGLVNAALRAVQRLGDGPRQRAFYEGPEPLDFFAEKELSPRAGPEAEDPFALAARYYGLPSALAACLVEEARGLPERVEALFRRSSERPWNGWRINASRPGAARLRRELLDSAASGAMHGEQFPAGLNGAVMAVSDWGLALPPGCLAHSADGRTLGELEADGLLSAQAAGSQQVLAALFDAVTPRTAGFNTTDTAALSSGSLLLTMALMFIGGSPGSTAGGIKTTTIAVILLHTIAGVRREQSANIFGRSIGDEELKKATSVLFTNLFLVLGGVLVICGAQSLPLTDVLFEAFSAMGTVGMSTGVTRSLSGFSRAVIIFLMYCGRVGSISFAVALLEKKALPPVTLPRERITIG